jgi:Tfp pilus assembly pilus retraction ATPase PilT
MQALIDLFNRMVAIGASDLHLQEETRPYFRVHGVLSAYDKGPVIDHAFMEGAREFLFG